MSEVTSERFCPICSQFVSRSEKGVLVKRKFPNTNLIVHEGCAKLVSIAYKEYKKSNLSVNKAKA